MEVSQCTSLMLKLLELFPQYEIEIMLLLGEFRTLSNQSTKAWRKSE